MARWLDKITQGDDDYTAVLEAFDHFEREHEEGAKELEVQGQRIFDVAARIGALFDYRYGQWKEIESIIAVLDLRCKRLQQVHRKRFLEHYNRDLSATTVERYAETEKDVLAVRELIIRMKLVEEKMAGLCSSLDKLDRQVRVLAELRRFGLDDATI